MDLLRSFKNYTILSEYLFKYGFRLKYKVEKEKVQRRKPPSPLRR